MSREESVQEGGWWSRHTSLVTRLAIAALVVSIIPVIASIALTVWTAMGDGQTVTHDRLKAVQGAKAAELEGYFDTVESTVKMLSASPMLIEGVRSFAEARAELDVIDLDDLTDERHAVSEYYLDEFVPALADVRGETVDVLGFVPGDDPATQYLQSAYIADNPFEMGEKRLLSDAEDGSAWTGVHKGLHPTLRAIVDRYGFEDLFLIDAETRQVLYSTNKDPSFATDLDRGPYAGTPLAELVEKVIDSGQSGQLVATDFSAYAPALDRPVAFVAAPLVDGDELAGVLVVGVPTDAVNSIMSRDWKAGRRGETGELFLVGSDLRMRSDSRSFVESPTEYLDRIEELGNVSEADRNHMVSLGTTILFQEIDSAAVRSALDGESGLVSGTSHLGEEVYSTYSPVVSELFGWALLFEQERAEFDEPFVSFVRDSLVVTVIFVIFITFVAVAWANSFVRPLPIISAALVRIREGDDDVSIPARGAREFRALASALDHMIVELDSRKQAVTAALAAKVEVLQTLLPPVAAERVGRGDRRLVDTVPQATVVVLILKGLDDVFKNHDTESNRDFVHTVVDEIDSLAARNGLERVRLSGDAYYAVCGVGTPHVDHASRTVTFAFQARTAVDRIARANGLHLGVSAGINSGSVTTGLIGGSRLVYDLWGGTVEDAYLVARATGFGDIVVTKSTRDRTPAGRAMESVDVLPGTETWRVHLEVQAGDDA